MSTQSDIEITVHNKKQLKVLLEKMILCKTIKFLFMGADKFRKESGVKGLIEDHLESYKDYPKHASVSLAYYEQGFILCIIVEDKLRTRVMNFLNSIKVPERTNESPTITETEKGETTSLYIDSLSKEKCQEIKKVLVEKGIMDLNERPFYEQDPVY